MYSYFHDYTLIKDQNIRIMLIFWNHLNQNDVDDVRALTDWYDDHTAKNQMIF